MLNHISDIQLLCSLPCAGEVFPFEHKITATVVSITYRNKYGLPWGRGHFGEYLFIFYEKHFPKVAQKGSTGQDLVPLHALVTRKRRCIFRIFNLWDKSQSLLAGKNNTHVVYGLNHSESDVNISFPGTRRKWSNISSGPPELPPIKSKFFCKNSHTKRMFGSDWFQRFYKISAWVFCIGVVNRLIYHLWINFIEKVKELLIHHPQKFIL